MTILFRGYSYPKSNLNHEQKENVNGRARLSENFKTDKPINGEWEIQWWSWTYFPIARRGRTYADGKVERIHSEFIGI